MTRRNRFLFLALPTALALANLGLYYGYVVPVLGGGNRPMYAHFWANYGDTPMSALLGMMNHPWSVLQRVMSSGVFRTVQPHLFLPFVGWRWALGTVPIVALYGASENDQVRAFAIYYPMVLVPFFVLAASAGALTLARRLVTNVGHAQLSAAVAVLLGPLLVGSGHRGYSLRPWKTEVSAVPQALAQLASEPRILVQSGLFPHAGYDERFQLLTPETLDHPRNAGAVLLLARRVGAYPFGGAEVAAWLSRLPAVRDLPGGLSAVRLTPEATQRPPDFRPGREWPRAGPRRPGPEWRRRGGRSGGEWRRRLAQASPPAPGGASAR